MTLSMPMKNAVLPSALYGQQNGKVDPALLHPVDARTSLVWLMCELPARGMRALHAQAAQAGITLSSTGRGRTYDQQVSLFLSRYTTTYLAGRPTKVWNGQVYYQQPNTAMAAVPGTSNHGWWCADDLAEIVNGAVVSLRSTTVQWLYANAPHYGFTWEMTTEQWHVDWSSGDIVPDAVLNYENGLGGSPAPAPTPPPPSPPASTQGDLMLGLITLSDADACFVGWCDAAGHFIQIGWTSADRYNIFLNAGAKVFTFPVAALVGCDLLGKLPVGDSRHVWTGAEFANWIS